MKSSSSWLWPLPCKFRKIAVLQTSNSLNLSYYHNKLTHLSSLSMWTQFLNGIWLTRRQITFKKEQRLVGKGERRETWDRNWDFVVEIWKPAWEGSWQEGAFAEDLYKALWTILALLTCTKQFSSMLRVILASFYRNSIENFKWTTSSM